MYEFGELTTVCSKLEKAHCSLRSNCLVIALDLGASTKIKMTQQFKALGVYPKVLQYLPRLRTSAEYMAIGTHHRYFFPPKTMKRSNTNTKD